MALRDSVSYEPVAGAWPASPDTLVVSQEPVWSEVEKRVPAGAALALLDSGALDEERLEQLGPEGEPRLVVGVGGGTAVDAAKYIAWRRELPLVVAPTALTVDAPFTETVAVRRSGRIRYTGEVYPDKIVIDLDLIRGAPPALNRGGVGDLLSIHTALFDWQLAHARRGETYRNEIAQESAMLLERLARVADEVRDVSEAGVRAMVELFCAEVDLCRRMGNSRPEEGSEHHVLYNLESRAGKTFLHGPAVTLCALLVSYLQRNEPERLRGLADRCGVDYAPAGLGIGRRDLVEALVGARRYAEEEELPFTFLAEVEITPALAESALRWVGA